MRQEIRLFIGDREIEFSQPPAIYYNYTETDLKNPTIVKNSFSKSITVEGTPTNNDIFGHFWNLERYQLGGGGSGPAFSPIEKADFKLYVNGNLYEQGYCKLDSVTKNGRKSEFTVILYGGLGELFTNLQYFDNGSDVKKTLADLVFKPYGDPEQPALDLDFDITKETVNQAWNQLQGLDNNYKKWNVINFAICAEGVPDDFEASKVLINRPDVISEMTSRDGDYGGLIGSVISGSGYALGEARLDLTSDMTLDLRSYLMRPVVSVKEVINAICMPENNGGFEIDLDPHFFNSSNPYYNDAWLTLNKLRGLGSEKVNTSTPTATISKTDYNWSDINFSSSLAKMTNFEFTTRLTVTGLGSTNATELWGSSEVKTDAQYHNSSEYVKEFEVNQSVMLQVVAYDSNGIEVARSNEVSCISEAMPSNTTYKGHFFKINNKWVFCDKDGNPYDIKFTLPSSTVFSTLKLYMRTPRHYKYRLTKGWIDKKNTVNEPNYNTLPIALYTQPTDLNWSGLHTLDDAFAHNRVQGYFAFSGATLALQMDDFSGGFSGTRITKDKLLGTSFSPAEFLLNYCKLFNLYFYKDPVEESDFPLIYPKGVIHICDRDTFYTGEYEDLQDRIDRSKTININPTLANTKWYNLSYQDGNGANEKLYSDKFGYQYGRQLVNTNLAFNNETTDLYDGSIFKNGVMVQEKCGYYMQPDYAVPVYVYDTFKYQLFKSGSTAGEYDAKDYNYPTKVFYTDDLNSQGLRYYDVMPKLQIHSDENKAEDGSGILLFFNTFINTPYVYNLTDDVPEMATLCDGNPCWLLTTMENDAAGNNIAIWRTSIPFFSRDIYNNGVSGEIIHTWNFGHPQVTFVPYTYSTDFDCIYDKCWKDYLTDLYDQNTKGVTCYVRLRGKPNPAMLRKWYWFDNAVWRINRIVDWNIGSYDPTMVEFIKVQDVNNYALSKIEKLGRIYLVILSTQPLSNSAQTVNAKVMCQNPEEAWSFGDVLYWEDELGNNGYVENPYSPRVGTGTTNVSISIPANSGSQRTYTVILRDNEYRVIEPYTYFTQAGGSVLDFATGSKNTTVAVGGGNITLYFVQQNIVKSSIAVSEDSLWCEITAVDTDNNTISITVDPSTMPYQRTATLTITGITTDGVVKSSQTHLYQDGGEIDVWPSDLNFDYNSTSGNTIIITTSQEWTATIDDNGE